MPELDQAALEILSVLILGAIRWYHEQVELMWWWQGRGQGGVKESPFYLLHPHHAHVLGSALGCLDSERA